MSNATATERLRKRFAKWDVDGSGSLEQADFQKEAEQIAQAFGKSPSGKEAAELNDAFASMFRHLAEDAGIGAAGSLTEDDFVRVAQKLMFEDGAESFNRVLGPVMRGIVGLCDKNADGQINRQEFASWLTAVGVDDAQATDAFDRVDTNGNGELTVDELLDAVRQFHFGELDVELLG
ncbi:EF-hand domain-containing protein [Saccharopolyspora sp. HNM0983]|uniref:EF-hand domain-containing protein n=1 Tax=Saccharopolyspora montiporae TaxID=2781240 RepID=A0A929B944_9PSEU|nr:EF-hand domain-containing protein [Saccharopolyspora sp. HNM0983]MBE9373691.1 EF-hand domain-containing protein [Saccharopolyspora sp. HNM0983]